jgi:hypothetical protein
MLLIQVQHDIGTGPTPTHPGTLQASDNPVAMSYNARMHTCVYVCCAAVMIVCWTLGTYMVQTAHLNFMLPNKSSLASRKRPVTQTRVS